MGFTPTKADPCIYLGGNGVILLAFVDDILILAQTADQIENVVTQLKQKFTLKELGEVKNYLGVQIQKTEKGYLWHQRDKILHLLDAYGLLNCKGVFFATPMTVDFCKGN